MYKHLIIIISIFLALPVMAQDDDVIHQNSENRVRAKVEKNGDTIALEYLLPIYVTEYWNPRKKKRYQKKYLKLIRDVKKAYPYAKLAGAKLNEYDDELRALKNDRERRRFLDKVEDELREEYEGDLRNLTIVQGVILIKLVDRETGDTSYELVKQFRGSFSAFFWQSVARLFGHNLKLRYDPMGEDYQIEEVVRLIEAGKV